MPQKAKKGIDFQTVPPTDKSICQAVPETEGKFFQEVAETERKISGIISVGGTACKSFTLKIKENVILPTPSSDGKSISHTTPTPNPCLREAALI